MFNWYPMDIYLVLISLIGNDQGIVNQMFFFKETFLRKAFLRNLPKFFLLYNLSYVPVILLAHVIVQDTAATVCIYRFITWVCTSLLTSHISSSCFLVNIFTVKKDLFKNIQTSLIKNVCKIFLPSV